MNRIPNTVCCYCNKPIYRRPSELKIRAKVYCSKPCKVDHYPKRKCLICLKEFKPSHSKNKLCSRSCSSKSRYGMSYELNRANRCKSRTARSLELLKINFNLQSCMVENCEYNKTYDIHRHIPGKDGGKYEIGNMFAICPNHHAEIGRNIIKTEKVNNFTLKILESR